MKQFVHRAAYGVWINDFRDEALRVSAWPCMLFDEEAERCLRRMIDTLADAGYNQFALWGLLNSYSWSDGFAREREPVRLRRVRECIRYAHERGMKILYGLGVYSWGVDEIIRNNPGVQGTNPHAMCGSREESFAHVTRIVDFLFDTLEVDGVHMESADLGRCRCEACGKTDNFLYYCGLSTRTARYIRGKYPDKLINVCMISWQPWDVKLTDPRAPEIDALVELSRHVDYIIDPGHLGHYIPAGARPAIIERLHCAFGTAGGTRLYYWPEWERLRTFLPYPHKAYRHLTGLLKAGGTACEYYVGPLVNPGAEVNTIMAGRTMSRPEAAYHTLMEETLATLYAPRDDAALKNLAALFENAENAFFDHFDNHFDAAQNMGRPDWMVDPKAYEAVGADSVEMYLRGATHLDNYLYHDRFGQYREALGALCADATKLLTRVTENGRVMRILQGMQNTIADLWEYEAYELWK